jgi:hypothetical protein
MKFMPTVITDVKQILINLEVVFRSNYPVQAPIVPFSGVVAKRGFRESPGCRGIGLATVENSGLKQRIRHLVSCIPY